MSLHDCPSCQCAPVNGTALTVEDLVDAYNAICVPAGLPAVLSVSASRRKKITARLLEQPRPEFWRRAFQAITRSRFLTGQTSEWRASLDWIVANDRNAIAATEGRYR